MLPLDQGKEALTKVVTATFGLKAGSPARSVFVSDTSESSLGAYQLTSALLKEAETHEHSTWQQHQGKALLLGKGFSRAQAWALQACRQELVAGPNFQPSDLLTQPCDDFDKPASAPLRRGSSCPAAKATPVAVIRASRLALQPLQGAPPMRAQSERWLPSPKSRALLNGALWRCAFEAATDAQGTANVVNPASALLSLPAPPRRSLMSRRPTCTLLSPARHQGCCFASCCSCS